MKILSRWIVLCLTFVSAVALAEEKNSPESARSWLQYQAEISKLWKIQNEFLSGNDISGSDQLFQQILFLKDRYGLTQVPSLSTSLLRKVPAQKTLGDKMKHPYFAMASQLSPDHYTNDYFLCDFLGDPIEWPVAARYCFIGIKKELSYPGEQLVFLSKISFEIFWTLVLLIIFFMGAYIHKLLPFMIQYYSSAFYWISPVAYAFLICMILLLVLFTFGWLLLFVLLFIGIWRFPSVIEKAHLFIVFCMVVVLPFTFALPAMTKEFHGGILFSVFNADQSLNPAKFEERITQYTRTHSNDAFALFKLGILQKKTGNLEDAMRSFKQSKIANPNFVKTDINLANIKFEMGDIAGSEEDYKKLITRAPKMLSPYMNMSQIYTSESKYLDGEDFINRAKKIDESKFRELSKQLHQRNGAVRPIYEDIEPSDMYSRIYSRDENFRFNFVKFFNHYFPKYSVRVYYYALLGALALALLFDFVTNTRNFYLLYYTREKNLENLTLVQLKEYLHIYRAFAARVVMRERIRLFFYFALPGYFSFCEGRLIRSTLIAGLFYFFLLGSIIEMHARSLLISFPWVGLYLTATCFIFLINALYIGMHNGQAKN